MINERNRCKYRFRKSLLCDETRSCGFGVLLEIIARAISTADALHPSITGLALGVPTVTGVVGHLVLHVLSEAHLGRIHAYHVQEQVDTSHEVAQRLVGYQTLR